MSKASLREDILNAGLKVMFRSGYQGATVRDICAAAGAPHGSFTNHFRSKEAFAQEVLDRYFAHLRGYVKEALDDESLTPRQRMKRYLDIISGVLETDKWNRGCLIGDFSLQASSESELLRDRLEAIFQEWRAPFASCIAAAQNAGEIDATFDPIDLAEFLLRLLGGSNSANAGRTRPGRARPLQENRLPHCIQGAEMTVLSDVALPQVDVLGSTIAYREAGHSEAPVALFLHGNRLRLTYGGISFRWSHQWRIASRRI